MRSVVEQIPALSELNAELEKGYADILSGRTKPAKQAFAEMRKDFNICNLK